MFANSRRNACGVYSNAADAPCLQLLIATASGFTSGKRRPGGGSMRPGGGGRPGGGEKAGANKAAGAALPPTVVAGGGKPGGAQAAPFCWEHHCIASAASAVAADVAPVFPSAKGRLQARSSAAPPPIVSCGLALLIAADCMDVAVS
eukprot:CAMPEP_0172808668 /NCGR_PEP_ID=MMETSP1075-20121228/7827_1 /TAXON_ID=2916 /ORGANISM="Ceratium fusus, Strain PA161109" /LENGTH=146 /DNA_ID=CAMNT_0013647849 /DNA_START=55 /DNA_END=494 /DNA_ORIENTATION=-